MLNHDITPDPRPIPPAAPPIPIEANPSAPGPGPSLAIATPAALAAQTGPRPSAPDSETEALGDRIASLCAHINAATYTLLVMLRVFDEEGGWNTFSSCAHWLSWRTGLSIGPAREKVRVARSLPALPLISESFKAGEISYSKVRALTRIANADNEAELLTFARHGTASHVERMVRYWRRIDRCDDSDNERHASRGLTLFPAYDGNYELRGRLAPEVGALLTTAIQAAERQLYQAEVESGTEDRPSAAQRRADALGLWLEERVGPRVQLVVNAFEPATRAKSHGTGEACAEPGMAGEESGEQNPGGLPAARAGRSRDVGSDPSNGQHGHRHCCGQESGRRAPFTLVTEDGSRVSAETSARLACDAEVVRIRRGEDGAVLDVGRRERFVGWRLRKALEARDGGCRFPGCGSRLRNHAHHIVPWAEGGVTAIHNLVLLCPFHHRAVHEGAWRVGMDDRGVPRFFNPLGARIPEAPEAPKASNGRTVNTGRELVGWHKQEEIDQWTGMSLWNGERIDWGFAMACLKPG